MLARGWSAGIWCNFCLHCGEANACPPFGHPLGAPFYLIKSAHFYIFAKFLISIISASSVNVFAVVVNRQQWQQKLQANDIFEYVVTPELTHTHTPAHRCGSSWFRFRCLLIWAAVSHVSSCQSALLTAAYVCVCVCRCWSALLSLLHACLNLLFWFSDAVWGFGVVLCCWTLMTVSL